MRRRRTVEAVGDFAVAAIVHTIHRNAARSPELTQDYRDFPKTIPTIIPKHHWRVLMTSITSEMAIDEIVARCNGDIRGALQALLLVNEQLETELAQLYAAVSRGGSFERGGSILH
jgi:hypothetical protein